MEKLRFPPTPTDMLEAADLLRRSPASTGVSPPAQVPARNLSFSIENILRSSFPISKKPQPSPAPAVKKPPPKIDVEVPVDLSKTSNEAPKTDADCLPEWFEDQTVNCGLPGSSAPGTQ